MLLRSTALTALLLGSSFSTSARSEGFIATPAKRQLSRLSLADADALLFKLKTAQTDLAKGEDLPFFLLSGSLASDAMARLSPRDAFLKLPFGDVWNIERLTADTRLPQRFRLAYAPTGLGQLYWNIEVLINIDGSIERVTMTYEPPAPF